MSAWRSYSMQAGVHQGRLLARMYNEQPLTIALQQSCQHGSIVLNVPTCQHLLNPVPLVNDLRSAITEALLPWETKKPFVYSGTRFRCPYCPSEYRVVTRGFESETREAQAGCRFLLAIERHIDMGKVRSPHNRNWAALVRPRLAGVVSCTPYDLQGLRAIKARFEAETKPGYVSQRDHTVVPLTDS